MAFTGNFICDSYKQELLVAEHDFTLTTGHDFYLALYDNSASFTAATTAYTATNEVANSGSYTAGGGEITSVTPQVTNNVAWVDFGDITFTSATITAYGCMIYNTTHAGNASIQIHDFSGAQISTAANFTIEMPAATSAAALIRIA